MKNDLIAKRNFPLVSHEAAFVRLYDISRRRLPTRWKYFPGKMP